MNIISYGFIHPIIGIFTGFLLIFGSEFLGQLLLKKNKHSSFFLNLAAGVILVSLIAYIVVLLGQSQYINPIISYFIVILGLYNFIYFIKKKIYLNYRLNFYSYLIFFYLLSLLLISISAPTMADALDYHLGVAKFIHNYHYFPNHNYSIHSTISGLGEIFNFLGLIVYSDVVGSLLQLISLASFLYYFSKVILDKSKYTLFCLFILSSPVIIYFVSGPKYQLFPQLITTFVLYLLIITRNFNIKLSLLLLFLIFGAASMKLSFFITGFILGIFLLIKSRINFNFVISALILSFFFFLPKSLFNFYTLENFTYINFFTSAPENFLKQLKNYNDNNFFFPLGLFFPMSFGKITTILGFQFLILFLIKKFDRENIEIFIVAIISSIFLYFMAQPIGRIFHEIILFLSLNIIFAKKYKFNINSINCFLAINVMVVFVISIFGVLSLSPSLINNYYRKEVMSINANYYKGADWVNKIIPSENIILTNIRSTVLLNAKAIQIQLPAQLDDITNYYNFLKTNKINYIVIINFDTKIDYFFKECNVEFVNQSPKFITEKRNFFNRNEQYSVTIFKIKNATLKNCI
jgi:hypothetical protein